MPGEEGLRTRRSQDVGNSGQAWGSTREDASLRPIVERAKPAGQPQEDQKAASVLLSYPFSFLEPLKTEREASWERSRLLQLGLEVLGHAVFPAPQHGSPESSDPFLRQTSMSRNALSYGKQHNEHALRI